MPTAVAPPTVAPDAEPAAEIALGGTFDTRKRSIAKALSWRVVATLITAVVAWRLTGRLDIAIEIGALDAAVKLVAFYGHERLWQHIRIGRLRPPEYRI